MTGALALAVLLQTQKPQKTKPHDFDNAQISIKYLRDVESRYGLIHYGNDLSPYLIEHIFDPVKPIPGENELPEPTPKSFTLSKPEKGTWKFSGPSNDPSLEVIADTNVVVVYHRRAYQGFTVLNAKTGAKLWTRKATTKGSSMIMTLVDGVLYQWDMGHFTATNVLTGDTIWDKPIDARWKNMEFSPIQVKSGRVYATLEVEKKVVLFCLDARSGGEVWRRTTGYPIGIVDQHNLPGVVVVGNRVVGYEFAKERDDQDLQKQSVFCLDAKTGEEQWKKPVDYTGWPFAPEANENAVFVGAVRRPSYLYNLAGGAQIAKLDLRWAHVHGPYVLDIDDGEGLVVYASSSGERIGRIQLTTRTYWQMQFVQDRLLLTHFADEDSRTTVVYEVIASK